MKKTLSFVLAIACLIILNDTYAQKHAGSSSLKLIKKDTFNLSEYHGLIGSTHMATSSQTNKLTKKIVCENQTILKLYQFAYENVPEEKFIFPEELSYLKSDSGQSHYNLVFMGTSERLISLLDSSFALITKKTIRDKPTLKLSAIKNSQSISLVTPSNPKKSTVLKVPEPKETKIDGELLLKELTKLLEETMGYPIEYDKSIENNNYKVHISLTGGNIDEQIDQLRNMGIIITKDDTKYDYVKIIQKD